MSYLSEFLRGFPGLFVHQSKIILIFLYVCQSVSWFPSLLKFKKYRDNSHMSINHRTCSIPTLKSRWFRHWPQKFPQKIQQFPPEFGCKFGLYSAILRRIPHISKMLTGMRAVEDFLPIRRLTPNWKFVGFRMKHSC